MIKIENLNKKYRDVEIFKDASFTFPDKGMICVFGPSGCGKSTLLNLIAGFDSEYEGEISVHGSSISKMNASELCAYRRDNIGFIFQNYHLLSGYTALENIMLAADIFREKKETAKQKALELMDRFGIADKANQKTETLSGGQKQRIAIVRALINQPSVLFADEPTGALDRKNSTEIMELLKNMSKDHLVIVITHDKKCAEYADQTVTISDGNLVCDSPMDNSVEHARLKRNKIPKISLWKRAYKNFKVHFRRYIAVAFAISIGVLCFGLSLSSENVMEQSIADFETKNTAYHNGYIKTDGNDEDVITLLKKDKRIENIYKQYVLKDVLVKIEQQKIDLPEKYPSAKSLQQMSYGVMPRRGKNEIAISPSMAAKFDKNIKNLIGKKTELIYNGQSYILTVSGIFNAVYDDYFVSSDIEQKIFSGLSEKVHSVSYDVIRFEDIVSVSNSLNKKNIGSQNASIEVASFVKTFQNLKRLFSTVSILILAVGIFISIILLVKQQNTRYREVGLLSALGYTKGNIRKILIYENVGLSILSVVCSSILIVLIIVISNVIEFSIVFSLAQIFVTLCLTMVLILIISLVSSIKLVNVEPAEAIRR